MTLVKQKFDSLRSRAINFGLLGSFALPLTELRFMTLTLSDYCLMASLFFWLQVVKNYKMLWNRIIPWYIVNIFFYVLIIILTSYNTIDAFANILGVLKLSFAIGVVCTVSYLNARFGGNPRQMLIFYSSGCAIAAVSTFFQPVSGYLAGEYVRYSGLGGHPVGLSISVGTAIAILVHLPRQNNRESLLLLLLLTINFIGMVRTLGITGLAISVIGILAGFTFRESKRENNFSGYFLGILIIFFVSTTTGYTEQIFKRISETLNPQAGIQGSGTSLIQGSTLSLRQLTWQAGWNRILEHPILGAGLDEQGQIAIGTLQLHNFFLLMWLSAGILGFLTSLVFLYALIRVVRIAYTRELRFNLNRVIIAVMVSLGVGLTVNPVLYSRMPYFLLGACCGIADLTRRGAPDIIN